MTASDLKPGDILLYRTRSLIGWIIRHLDESHYNHAAIWDGEKAVEMLAGGCVHNTLSDSIRGSHVDVYRLAPCDKYEEIISNVMVQISCCLHHREKYAFEQLALLAVLTEIRHRSPWLSWVARHWFEIDAEKLEKTLPDNRRRLICSELVYRCYMGSHNDNAIHLQYPNPIADFVTPGDLARATNLVRVRPLDCVNWPRSPLRVSASPRENWVQASAVPANS